MVLLYVLCECSVTACKGSTQNTNNSNKNPKKTTKYQTKSIQLTSQHYLLSPTYPPLSTFFPPTLHPLSTSPASHCSIPLTYYSMSWLKQVRALPSNPSSNDILKVEYLDVNLNNSRKLMGNISNLSAEAKVVAEKEESTVEAMLQLKNLRNELSWTDSIR